MESFPKSVLAACFGQGGRHWQCYQYSEMCQKALQEQRAVPTVLSYCVFSYSHQKVNVDVSHQRDTHFGNKSTMNWLKLASQKAPYWEVLKWEACPHRNKVLSSFPKQKNKQYSTANIQRPAHHVCLPCNNKSWNTAIASGWLKKKLTLVPIELGGLHAALMLQKLPSQLAALLQRSEPVVNPNQWWTSPVGRHWQWHVTASYIAPARGTNRTSATTAVNPELNSLFSSRCLLWKPCHAYQEN